MPESLTNIKERKLTCTHCRYDVDSAEPTPKCARCGRALVVVLYSVRTLVGEPRVRLTGEPSVFHVE